MLRILRVTVNVIYLIGLFFVSRKINWRRILCVYDNETVVGD